MPDAAARPLPAVQAHLIDRIAEAEPEGWFGEVEGLQVSLVGDGGKLAQPDTEVARRSTVVSLGMATFDQIPSRTEDAAPSQMSAR